MCMCVRVILAAMVVSRSVRLAPHSLWCMNDIVEYFTLADRIPWADKDEKEVGGGSR